MWHLFLDFEYLYIWVITGHLMVIFFKIIFKFAFMPFSMGQFLHQVIMVSFCVELPHNDINIISFPSDYNKFIYLYL